MKKQNILTRDIDLSSIYDNVKASLKNHTDFLIRILLCTALLLRVIGTFYTKSVDYGAFLAPWVRAYSKMTFTQALRTKVTNYYVPYNLILIIISRFTKFKIPPFIGISLVSCVADAGTAYFVYKIFLMFFNNMRPLNEKHNKAHTGFQTWIQMGFQNRFKTSVQERSRIQNRSKLSVQERSRIQNRSKLSDQGMGQNTIQNKLQNKVQNGLQIQNDLPVQNDLHLKLNASSEGTRKSNNNKINNSNNSSLIIKENPAAIPTACLAGAVVLILPAVFLDSAWWKQCDSIYTLFALMCVYFFMKNKYFTSILMFSIGFSFKLQIIFILPFLGIMWLLKRNFSFMDFLLIPGVYAITGLPSLIAGMNWKSVYGTYFAQAGMSRRIFISYPNLYSFVTCLPGKQYVKLYLSKAPMILTEALTAAVILCSCIVLFIYRERLKPAYYTAVAGWYVWTCCMFLPCMHERYDFAGLILIFVYGFCINRKFKRISILINILAGLDYLPYIFMTFSGIPVIALAVINFVFYIWFSYLLFKEIKTGKM